MLPVGSATSSDSDRLLLALVQAKVDQVLKQERQQQQKNPHERQMESSADVYGGSSPPPQLVLDDGLIEKINLTLESMEANDGNFHKYGFIRDLQKKTNSLIMASLEEKLRLRRTSRSGGRATSANQLLELTALVHEDLCNDVAFQHTWEDLKDSLRKSIGTSISRSLGTCTSFSGFSSAAAARMQRSSSMHPPPSSTTSRQAPHIRSRPSVIFSETSTSEVSYFDTESSTSDYPSNKLTADLDISQPLLVRLAALESLNTMAIGDLVSGELWPSIKQLLEDNLSHGEEEIQWKCMQFFHRAYRISPTSVLNGLVSYLIQSMLSSDTVERDVRFVHKLRFLNHLLRDIPTNWIRLSEEELEHIFTAICDFLQFVPASKDVPSPLFFMADVDPSASWFTQWTLTHFGRRQLFAKMRESSTLSFVVPQLLAHQSQLREERSNTASLSYSITILSQLVRFEGARRLFPVYIVDASGSSTEEVTISDLILVIIDALTAPNLSATLHDQITNVLEYWNEDEKLVEAMAEPIVIKRLTSITTTARLVRVLENIRKYWEKNKRFTNISAHPSTDILLDFGRDMDVLGQDVATQMQYVANVALSVDLCSETNFIWYFHTNPMCIHAMCRRYFVVSSPNFTDMFSRYPLALSNMCLTSAGTRKLKDAGVFASVIHALRMASQHCMQRDVDDLSEDLTLRLWADRVKLLFSSPASIRMSVLMGAGKDEFVQLLSQWCFGGDITIPFYLDLQQIGLELLCACSLHSLSNLLLLETSLQFRTRLTPMQTDGDASEPMIDQCTELRSSLLKAFTLRYGSEEEIMTAKEELKGAILTRRATLPPIEHKPAKDRIPSSQELLRVGAFILEQTVSSASESSRSNARNLMDRMIACQYQFTDQVSFDWFAGTMNLVFGSDATDLLDVLRTFTLNRNLLWPHFLSSLIESDETGYTPPVWELAMLTEEIVKTELPLVYGAFVRSHYAVARISTIWISESFVGVLEIVDVLRYWRISLEQSGSRTAAFLGVVILEYLQDALLRETVNGMLIHFLSRRNLLETDEEGRCFHLNSPWALARISELERRYR